MWTVIIIIAVLLIALLAGLFAAYYKIYYSPKKDMSETESPSILKKHPYVERARAIKEELISLPFERISVRSYDGLKLSARYYEGDPEKPLCLCCHGYRGSAYRDFACDGLFLIKEGYNVILIDERAHWHSEGHTISFGIRERYDVLTWLSYMNKRFGDDKPIFVFGISMGGGTVLMASGLDLPDNVKGIVADCPFNSPMEAILFVARRIGLNPTLIRPAAWLSGLIYGRLNVCATTAAGEVKKTKKPILVMHGEEDKLVPCYMSHEIKDANPDMVELHTFPGADHGLSYLYDTERYTTVLRRFIKENLEKDA